MDYELRPSVVSLLFIVIQFFILGILFLLFFSIFQKEILYDSVLFLLIVGSFTGIGLIWAFRYYFTKFSLNNTHLIQEKNPFLIYYKRRITIPLDEVSKISLGNTASRYGFGLERMYWVTGVRISGENRSILIHSGVFRDADLRELIKKILEKNNSIQLDDFTKSFVDGKLDRGLYYKYFIKQNAPTFLMIGLGLLFLLIVGFLSS